MTTIPALTSSASSSAGNALLSDNLKALVDKVHTHALKTLAVLTVVLGASIVLAVTVQPLAFTAVGALGILWLLSVRTNVNKWRDKPPFDLEHLLASKPVGIGNSGNNCFINSFFQCMANNRPLAEWVASKPKSLRSFHNFLIQYNKAQHKGKKVEVDSQRLRECIREINSDISLYGQEDAAEIWQAFSDGFPKDSLLGTLIRESINSGAKMGEDTDYSIDIPLADSEGSFNARLKRFFYRKSQNETTGETVEQTFKFKNIPPFLVIKAGRFGFRQAGLEEVSVLKTVINSVTNFISSFWGYQADPSTQTNSAAGEFIPYKIDKSFDCPETFPLSKDVIDGSDQDISYEMDGFLIHDGISSKSGHYRAYVKKQDKWYECNDLGITEARSEEVKQNREKAYVYFYHRA